MMADPNPAFVLLGALLLLAMVAWRLRGALHFERDRAAAAERLAAARGRCLSLAAQELRGPGLVLMGQIDMLPPERRLTGEAATLDTVAQQLLRLADDLADFATEATARTLHDAPAPLGPLIDAAVAAVAAQIRPAHRHWQVSPALRNLTVRADRRALEGAIGALLRRAARHSREGDVITLRHVMASETIAIIVEDEGDGLPSQDLVAETASATPGTRGLDLGLSLARSLAAAHGGDIRLESAPGIGARAWLTLPRARLMEAY